MQISHHPSLAEVSLWSRLSAINHILVPFKQLYILSMSNINSRFMSDLSSVFNVLLCRGQLPRPSIIYKTAGQQDLLSTLITLYFLTKARQWLIDWAVGQAVFLT